MGAVTTARNRVEDESGKGIEAMRCAQIQMNHSVAGSQSPVGIIGPFDTDYDVVEIAFTAGLVPADNASNLITVYSGTVAANKPIVALNYSSATGTVLAAQVPVIVPVGGGTIPTNATVTQANQRLVHGNPLSIVATFAGNDASASAQVTIWVALEIPITAGETGGATTQSYGGYGFTGHR